MQNELFLLDLIVIIVSCMVMGYLLIKAKEPVIIGYIIAGIIAGGSVLGLVKDISIIEVFAQIGIALILFTVGIEFSFKPFSKYKKLLTIGPIVQILLSSLAIYAFFSLFFSQSIAIFLGVVFSLSSSAVVIKLFTDKKVTYTPASQISTAWLVLQDLAVIPISILLMSMKGGGFSSLNMLLIALAKSAGVLIVSLYILRPIIRWLFEKIAKVNSRELLLISSMAFALAMAFMTEQLGITSVLGAFLAGFLLSGTTFYTQIYTEIRSIKDLFSMLFFFSIGALLNFDFVLKNLILVLFVALVVSILKVLTITFSAKIFKLHTKIALQIGLSLFQIGEFSFVLGKLAVDEGILPPEIYALILATSIITNIATPLFIFRGDDIYIELREFSRKHIRFLYEKFFIERGDYKKDLKGIDDHVVICGFGRVGKAVVHALIESKTAVVVVDSNKNHIDELNQKNILSINGDSGDVEVLEKADVERATAIVVAVPAMVDVLSTVQAARMLNPNIYVIARLHDPSFKQKLIELNVDMIIEPEFESSKRIVKEILPLLGKRFKRRIEDMEKKEEDYYSE